MKNLKAIERDKWLESAEGQRCVDGHTEGQYLKNRIETAWCDGWDAALVNNHIIVGALDTLAVALSNHNHTWSNGERVIYEHAIAIARGEVIPSLT